MLGHWHLSYVGPSHISKPRLALESFCYWQHHHLQHHQIKGHFHGSSRRTLARTLIPPAMLLLYPCFCVYFSLAKHVVSYVFSLIWHLNNHIQRTLTRFRHLQNQADTFPDDVFSFVGDDGDGGVYVDILNLPVLVPLHRTCSHISFLFLSISLAFQFLLRTNLVLGSLALKFHYHRRIHQRIHQDIIGRYKLNLHQISL